MVRRCEAWPVHDAAWRPALSHERTQPKAPLIPERSARVLWCYYLCPPPHHHRYTLVAERNSTASCKCTGLEYRLLQSSVMGTLGTWVPDKFGHRAGEAPMVCSAFPPLCRRAAHQGEKLCSYGYDRNCVVTVSVVHTQSKHCNWFSVTILNQSCFYQCSFCLFFFDWKLEYLTQIFQDGDAFISKGHSTGRDAETFLDFSNISIQHTEECHLLSCVRYCDLIDLANAGENHLQPIRMSQDTVACAGLLFLSCAQ